MRTLLLSFTGILAGCATQPQNIEVDLTDAQMSHFTYEMTVCKPGFSSPSNKTIKERSFNEQQLQSCFFEFCEDVTKKPCMRLGNEAYAPENISKT